MRPDVLSPLFAAAQALTGVGPRVATFLKKALRLPPGVTEPRVVDLVWHAPTGLVDRRAEPTVAGAVTGTIATFKVRVLKHKPSPRGNNKAPYKVSCEDDSGRLDLIFFHAERKFIERQLPEGAERYVSGRVERYGETLQMVHPDYIVPPEARGDLPMLEPVYPLTAGLSGKVLGKIVRQAVERVPDLRGVAGSGVARRARLAGLPGRHPAVASPGRPRRHLDRRAGVAAARLRRTAGRAARAGPRSPEHEVATRSRRDRRWPHPRAPAGGDAVRADGLADHGAGRDRGRHRRAAPHAAAAAGRRRLRQDRRRVDGDGDRGRGRRAGRPDGADRGACTPARRDDRAARRQGRPPDRAHHRAREGPAAPRGAGAAGQRRDRHPDRHACAVPARRRVRATWRSP